MYDWMYLCMETSILLKINGRNTQERADYGLLKADIQNGSLTNVFMNELAETQWMVCINAIGNSMNVRKRVLTNVYLLKL